MNMHSKQHLSTTTEVNVCSRPNCQFQGCSQSAPEGHEGAPELVALQTADNSESGSIEWIYSSFPSCIFFQILQISAAKQNH